MTRHERSIDADGTAALGICESLLLALTDLKIISDEEALGILGDVVTTHRQAAETLRTRGKHDDVADIVQCIIDSDNGIARSVLRPGMRADFD